MDFIERLGYVKRSVHNDVLRRKNEMHSELAKRFGRIEELEFALSNEKIAHRKLRVQSWMRLGPSQIETLRKSWFLLIDFMGTMRNLTNGNITALAAWDRFHQIAARAAPLVHGPDPFAEQDPDWLQAGPGAKCLWCEREKPQICEWATSPNRRHRIKRYFCNAKCRDSFNLGTTIGARAPIAVQHAFGKQPPVNIGNTCSHCSKKIPFAGVTIWVNVDNTTEAQQAATGKTQVLPFCSYNCARKHQTERLRDAVDRPVRPCRQCGYKMDGAYQVVWAHTNETTASDIAGGLSVQFPFCSQHCLGRYRRGEPRTLGAISNEQSTQDSGSFSAKKRWAETLALLDKHNKDMDAMAAMWGHALGSESPSGNRVFHLDDFHWHGCPGCFRLRERLDSALDEAHRLHNINKKLRAVAAEDGRRIEELRCQAGDLSDRMEKVEHERDKALADFDRSVGIRRDLEAKNNALHLQLTAKTAEAGACASRLEFEEGRANRLAASNNGLCDDVKRLNQRFENDQLTIQNLRDDAIRGREVATAAPLTDDEAADVVMPLMSDFDCGEDYVRAVQVAINDVTSRRQ